MRLIDADRLITRLNDYALQESPMYLEASEYDKQLAVYEAIQDCISMVEEADTVRALRVVAAETEQHEGKA